MRKGYLLLVITLSVVPLIAMACQKETSEKVSILFVGNSLTYSNDLPALVKKAAFNQGYLIETDMLALPDYSLEDHWNDGQLQELLQNNKYDFVIIQQGPSSQAEGRKTLFDYGAKINELCKEHNAILVYFMVWPAHANYINFDGVINNYTEASQHTNSILCPVGEEWKQYIDNTGDLSYYGPDLFHPSLKGSEVAAEIIFKTIIGN